MKGKTVTNKNYQLILVFFLFIIACGEADTIDLPSGKILFQPMFTWVDSETTYQGTGYLIRNNNQIYAITSLHFLNFDGPGLLKATWLDIPDNTPELEFQNCLGKPEIRGLNTYSDLEHDFLVLPVTCPPSKQYSVLEIDTRSKINSGEKLLFPNKDNSKELGYTWIPAIVTADHGKYINIKLIKSIRLQSQSGSPVISKRTGKVIGMLSTGKQNNGEITLSLCPVRNIAEHINKNNQLNSLQMAIK